MTTLLIIIALVLLIAVVWLARTLLRVALFPLTVTNRIYRYLFS